MDNVHVMIIFNLKYLLNQQEMLILMKKLKDIYLIQQKIIPRWKDTEFNSYK